MNIIYVLLKFWYMLFLYSMKFIRLEFLKVFEAFFLWKIWIGLRALSKDRGVKKLIQDFLISEIWKKMFVRLSELDNFRLLTFTFIDTTCFLDQRIRKTKLAISSLFYIWCDRPIFRLDLFFLFLTYLLWQHCCFFLRSLILMFKYQSWKIVDHRVFFFTVFRLENYYNTDGDASNEIWRFE